jgi:hypothetical protein
MPRVCPSKRSALSAQRRTVHPSKIFLPRRDAPACRKRQPYRHTHRSPEPLTRPPTTNQEPYFLNRSELFSAVACPVSISRLHTASNRTAPFPVTREIPNFRPTSRKRSSRG